MFKPDPTESAGSTAARDEQNPPQHAIGADGGAIAPPQIFDHLSYMSQAELTADECERVLWLLSEAIFAAAEEDKAVSVAGLGTFSVTASNTIQLRCDA